MKRTEQTEQASVNTLNFSPILNFFLVSCVRFLAHLHEQ